MTVLSRLVRARISGPGKYHQRTSVCNLMSHEAQSFRIEKDSLGEVKVPSQSLWGAQTQRSIENFKIGDHERFPDNFIKSMAIVKLAAARVNNQTDHLSKDLCDAIIKASEEIIDGKHNKEFPLVIWQTGSGTQTNMNTNEVVANRAIQLLDGQIGTKSPIHPNDHVNMGQSSNDAFPTAMHISTAVDVSNLLLPALRELESVFGNCVNKFNHIIKIGRTHLQDATPLTLGQEFSGFQFMIKNGIRRIESSLEPLFELAQGGTAVGTGINTYEGFDEKFALEVKKYTGLPFKTSPNKFESLGGVGALVEMSSAISTTAADMLKIANDIRLLSSGPRSGFGELILPSNEPGSSIMPGKVNPTQCEALSMVCAEVIGNHTTIMISSTHGHLQLNVFRPVIIFNLLRSIRLLSDAANSFNHNCLAGIEPNLSMITKHLSNSLMLVTAMAPHIGYDKCAKIALHAHEKGISLKQAATELKFVTEEIFDQIVQPQSMTHPSKS